MPHRTLLEKLLKPWATGLLIGLDLLFFGSTNPLHGQVWVIMAGCILVVATIVSLYRLLFLQLMPSAAKTRRVLVVMCSVVSLYLLFMQSIGQLNVRDAVALIPLVVLLYFYLTYSGKLKQTG